MFCAEQNILEITFLQLLGTGWCTLKCRITKPFLKTNILFPPPPATLQYLHNDYTPQKIYRSSHGIIILCLFIEEISCDFSYANLQGWRGAGYEYSWNAEPSQSLLSLGRRWICYTGQFDGWKCGHPTREKSCALKVQTRALLVRKPLISLNNAHYIEFVATNNL